MNPIETAPLAIAVTAFVVYRQMRIRVATGYGLQIFALIMIAVGLLSGGLIDTRDLALSVALMAVDLACAVAFGFLRAATVRVWRDEKGVTWCGGTVWTLLGWLASMVARIALYVVGRAFGMAPAPTAMLLFVGVTIGAQALLVARRARALSASGAASVPAGV
ncbi:hypothetical protein [Sphaerisporangium perillae]|uniref:hypothetical protein n=1 Tax=Sphaerisporangium perillae TaxID=2935860 RepID=UPI00200DAC08|nr:hypothetical protein [Sphaerisporangium perillae]